MKGKFEKMKNNTIKTFVNIFVYAIALTLLAGSEGGATAFVKKVKGAGRVSAAVQTTDGSYVSISSSDYNSWVVRKISGSGKRIWERTLSFETAGGYVFIDGIAETNDGYVLVGVGALEGYYSNATAVIIKLKRDGTVRSSKSFTSAEALETTFRSVFSRSDGGYIVQGTILNFPYGTIVLKFTSHGKILWSESFPELAYSFSQPVSDGLILVHQSDTGGLQPTVRSVLKVDDSGRIVWKEILKIEGFQLHTLGPAAGNGVVLAGKSSDPPKLILIGLNANGELDWRATYSLNVPDFDISSLVQTSDAGYVITGTSFNPTTDGNRDGVLLRIDAKRNLVFYKTIGLSDTEEDAVSVFATAEGGFTVFGSSGQLPLWRAQNDMLILSLNSDGVVPHCGFLHKLTAKKVASPAVTSENLKITSRPFSPPTRSMLEVTSVASENRSSSACP